MLLMDNIRLDHLEIPPESLRRICRTEEIPYENTTQAPVLQDFIGQERAIKAMQFGLAMKAPGYNIYVAGPPGTGKSSHVQNVLNESANNMKVPNDWCFLYNFSNPDQPIAVSLPPGNAQIFKRDMEELISDIQTTIPKAFEGVNYEKDSLISEMQQQIQNELENLHEEAAASGIFMKQGQDGMMYLPLKDGKRMKQEEFEVLSPENKKEIQNTIRQLQQKFEKIINSGRFLEKKAKERIRILEKQIANGAIGPLVEQLKEKYKNVPRLINFLDEVAEDITRHLEFFKSEELSQVKSGSLDSFINFHELLNRYKVNLFVNNTATKGAPVIIESNPTYYNLFGKIEYRSIMGSPVTDLTMIKAGAIHRANGGYLVMQAKDVLTDPFAWDALKKAIKNLQTIVENAGEQYRVAPTASLRPEPIPLNVKVVLIGSHFIYHILHTSDEDFQKLFKVMVDFDTEMSRTTENINNYVAFVGSVCLREKLKPFDRTGLAELVEFGSRLCGNQNKLSTRFNEVVNAVFEAAACADAEGSEYVNSIHVQRAIKERFYRYNRIEEKIQEMILQNKILVDVQGAVVGQVNGLAVLTIGDYAFGKPSRITAKTFMGQEGVVNIERETRMSGSLHTKGILTLSGFLGDSFARDKPLRLSARITFEQLYEGIDGDSASSAELYALLSSLSGLPVRQGLAVTGSVNQNGEIQPIGGVTEKIEGFYYICRAKGLTGEQGVIIPYQNMDNLMLDHEIIQAVIEGKFHIYAVRNVKEGISLLTGVAAGEIQPESGSYAENTVFFLVDKKLREYAEGLSTFSGKEKNKKAPLKKRSLKLESKW